MRAVANRLSLQNVGVRVFLSALVLCALAIPVMGQSTASLSGTITDATGAAVPNADTYFVSTRAGFGPPSFIFARPFRTVRVQGLATAV